MTVVGIDACKKGWTVVAVSDGTLTAHFLPKIELIDDEVAEVSTIAIDIPIGLPEQGHREADHLARAYVGPRRSSVFPVPVREALNAPEFVEANRISFARSGSGLSKQSYALREKIMEVDTWLAASLCSVWEVHPEVSFRGMVGAPLQYSKKSWAGMNLRRSALQQAGIDIDEIIDYAGGNASTDDLLDAAAAAWSADRIQRGVQESFPSQVRLSSIREGNVIWF